MSKVGVYRTPSGNVPAIINELDNGQFDILTLGNANAQRKVNPVDVSYADGAASKYLYVDSLESFSSPAAEEVDVTVVGDEITVGTGVVIVPIGLVDLGSAYIELNGGTVIGRSAVQDGFMSTTTGGVIRHQGGNLSTHDYYIVAPAGPGFVGNGSQANGDIAKLRMIGVFSSPLGFQFTGYAVPSMESCFTGQLTGFGAPAVGAKFLGTIGKIHVQNTPFFDITDACIVIDSAATIDEADIAGNYYDSVAGVNFLRAEAGFTILGYAEVDRNIPRGQVQEPTDFVDGILLSDPQWEFRSNPGFPNSRAIGGFYQGSGFQTTTINAQSTPEKANVTVTPSDENQRFTVLTDGTLRYTGVRAWTVNVMATGRVDAAQNGQEIEISIYKDGVQVPESRTVVRINTGGDQRTFSTSCAVQVKPPSWHDTPPANCDIEVYVANLSSTNDVDVSDLIVRAS